MNFFFFEFAANLRPKLGIHRSHALTDRHSSGGYPANSIVGDQVFGVLSSDYEDLRDQHD